MAYTLSFIYLGRQTDGGGEKGKREKKGKRRKKEGKKKGKRRKKGGKEGTNFHHAGYRT